MYKVSISLINNSNENYIRSFPIDGIEVIAGKNKISNGVCSIQSLFYGLDSYVRIVDDPELFLNYLSSVINDANKVKSNLVFGSPKLRSYDISEEELFINFLVAINDMCDGAIFSIEPNASIYGGSNLLTTNETIDFIRKLNLPNIKLNLDLGTAYYNNEIFDKDFINDNLDIINHIHISAPWLRSITSVDKDYYCNFIDELKCTNYNKFVSLESLDSSKNEIDYFLSLVK